MNHLLFLGNIGFNEMLVILLVVLVLFGGRKIPELARGIGQGIREFNNARNNVQKELEEGIKAEEKKTEPTAK
ncbi:MAG: twin-arginine translocase TatA/TatE family subunit [Sphingobacteriales bacterium]|jgi:sec-independent protein translocase protein TatA|nr:twin-arginine translocase TatA/TatE family subunit [Sphingobacteriales bacterium]MBP9140541.1 twin-arginine translocase TatA/TatE family subunit [Chitinophagales bacterium]MDA0197279.1 twin-arginine translocase TatA/TatE family subunit [Bacteroidota bacterium]MBK6890389.1 twin-arginine translocase TatA/TatE family subunit [Sphingobacteriales bacterium]MBK7526556.1 twin-arginine translocase TatA/TatE family subunit [Sphingobacteriales bacterium]